MRLPTPLLRSNKNVHKNTFGHLLILAGSRRMLGAAALSSLAAARSGAGLVTVGIPRSLNSTLQKKISNVVMSLPLNETREQSLSKSAYLQIKRILKNYSAIAIGPGLSSNKSTQELVLKLIETSKIPMIIDADALNALAKHISSLKKGKTLKVLTPHPGEMARLLRTTKNSVEKNRRKTATDFAKKHNCVLLLKGPETIVADSKGKIFINKTGNAGMATAGTGDVLTGMIGALLAQGLSGFDAAKYGSYLHGKAGNFTAKRKSKLAMIASDIIDDISKAVKISS